MISPIGVYIMAFIALYSISFHKTDPAHPEFTLEKSYTFVFSAITLRGWSHTPTTAAARTVFIRYNRLRIHPSFCPHNRCFLLYQLVACIRLVLLSLGSNASILLGQNGDFSAVQELGRTSSKHGVQGVLGPWHFFGGLF